MLKKILLSLLAVSFACGLFAQNTDILHYKFEIRLTDANDTIFGTTTIIFKANKVTDDLLLDLSNVNHAGKGMTITEISNDRTNKLKKNMTAIPPAIVYWHKTDKLKIKFPYQLQTDEQDTFTIRYKGIPTDGLIISKNKFGDRTFFSDNWPDRAHNWIPCVDRPDDKASFEFLVTAPDHYQVISNGVLVEETNLEQNYKLTHWKEDIALPTKIMVIGVARFAVNYIGNVNDCIPVSSWVFPENKEAGFYDYALAKDILHFFINYIGPYPYKKLANVQSKTIFGGMENAGAIFYHENSVAGHREEESLLAHEIVHQWFGNMASEKNFSHLWLSEGFATYLTHIYNRSAHGTEKFLEGLKNDRQEVISYLKYTNKPIVDSITPRRQLINTNNYARAGWVLHMLHHQLGDSVFHQLIRTYYETYKGKNAYTGDFQKIAEQVSGLSLATFFRQWLYSPVIPKLKIDWKYDAAARQVNLTVSQLQGTVPFQFPLEIEMQTGNSSASLHKYDITKSEETFTIKTDTRPVRIIADPNCNLLFEARVTENK